MDIQEKVNELLPDLEDFLDRQRVQKINEAAGNAEIIKINIDEIARQASRNRKVVEGALKDLVRRDTRKALVALEWLSELVGDIHADLEG
jgi:hypothetical protein